MRAIIGASRQSGSAEAASAGTRCVEPSTVSVSPATLPPLARRDRMRAARSSTSAWASEMRAFSPSAATARSATNQGTRPRAPGGATSFFGSTSASTSVPSPMPANGPITAQRRRAARRRRANSIDSASAAPAEAISSTGEGRISRSACISTSGGTTGDNRLRTTAAGTGRRASTVMRQRTARRAEARQPDGGERDGEQRNQARGQRLHPHAHRLRRRLLLGEVGRLERRVVLDGGDGRLARGRLRRRRQRRESSTRRSVPASIR